LLQLINPKTDDDIVFMVSIFRFFLFAVLISLPAHAWAERDEESARWLTVWAGMLPIILAAPHGGRSAVPGIALRRGLGIPQFTTERDSNTAELAELAGAKLEALLGARPFLIVAHFERKFIDVNRAESGAFESASAKPYYDAYHDAVKEASSRVRQRWGSGLLLDIHGQRAEAETIFRGTHNGRSTASLRRRFGVAAVIGPKSILGYLAARGYRIEPTDDHERRYTGGYTTQSYGSHRGTEIDAMQLEFGADLRRSANLERTAADFAKAIEIFAREYLPLATRSPASTADP
jgi:N-formylglutamate amidohydrolase